MQNTPPLGVSELFMEFSHSSHHAREHYCPAGESSSVDSIAQKQWLHHSKGCPPPEIAVDYHLYNGSLITNHLQETQLNAN